MSLNCLESGSAGKQGRVLLVFAVLLIAGVAALRVDIKPATPQVGGSASDRALATPGASRSEVLTAYGRLPLMFEANLGQTDSRVKFLARGSGYGLFLTDNEAVLALHAQSKGDGDSALRMTLAGSHGPAAVEGAHLLPGKSNYFIGNDPKKWQRDVPQFSQVRYQQVYPGIDLTYYGNQGRLEYDFAVSPGTDPQQIVIKLDGASDVAIDSKGELVVGIGNANLRMESPVVYQEFGSERKAVPAHFRLLGNEQVGFEIAPYDRSRALVIDPVLTYSTYLGGSGAESCSVITGQSFTPGCPAITVDLANNAYVAGATTSTNFPVTSGALQATNAGSADVFIAKFNSSGSFGTTLDFATYLGGSGLDYPAGIAVDAASNVYVAGTTFSTNFPTNGRNAPFQGTLYSSNGDAHVFVSEINSAGSILNYSTYLSGNGTDIATGIALDTSANAYVSGTTTSAQDAGFDFPSTPGSLQTAPKATNQFFFSKLDTSIPGSTSMVYSTYIGGSNPSNGTATGGGIAVDSSGNAYVTGGTNFTDMPLLNAYQSSPKGGLDVYAAKINPVAATGAQLIYGTYIGGSGNDIGYGIAVDNTSNTYITGSTDTLTYTDFGFVLPSNLTLFQSTYGGNPSDGFLVKLGIPCTGSGCTTSAIPFSYFSYIGGSGQDVGTAITVDTTQGARITGLTNSTNIPELNNPVQPGPGGGFDAFAARIDTSATTNNAPGHYFTYLGGSGTDMGTSIAVDAQGASYVAGETASTNFPVQDAFQGALDGPSDAFVTKLGPKLALGITGTATPSPAGVGNLVTFTYTITNTGDFTNGVTFTDTLPTTGIASFTSATANPGNCGTANSGTVVCNLGTLNSAAIATVTIGLTPTVGGPLGNTGVVSVQGSSYLNNPNPPPSVSVTDFTLGQPSPSAVTVPAGVPATYNVTVSPIPTNGSFPDGISLSCGSGLPTGTSCTATTNPIPALNAGPASTELVINTTARVTTTTQWWKRGGPIYAGWLPVSGLAIIGVGFGRKRSWRNRIAAGIVLSCFFAVMLTSAGCGSSSTTTTTGTPAGTYTVTVNATSGSAVRTATVTLVVQ